MQQYVLSKQAQQLEPIQEELNDFIEQAVEGFKTEKTSFNIKTVRIDSDGSICVESPEPDSIYVSAEDENIDENRFVCEKTTISKSELVAMRYDEEIFKNIAKAGDTDYKKGNEIRDDSMEVIDFYDCYIKYDKGR